MSAAPARIVRPRPDQTSIDLGFAKSLLRDIITAVDAPEDVRAVFMDYAVAHIRREIEQGGRLAQ